MQSCSIHHCVLFFLTLTFTTAPVSAAVCPTTVKGQLHQAMILPCEYKCSGSVKWALERNRDVVFARCDQTSCSSLEEGFNISHDQYLKGDLSLTITAADYSKRNTYACECGDNDISTVSLRIETVFSAVQMNPGEHLILDLSVPEPVKVIYKSRDSAVGEQICTVTQRSLQCKAEYTHRTSLSYPELTLRDVQPSDSGSYTIRDLKNNEDIRVYTVSVAGLPVWATVLIVLAVLLLVGLLIAGVIIYRRKVEQERREVKSRKEEVAELIEQVQPNTEAIYVDLWKEEEELKEKVKKAEKAINELEQQYRENRKHSEYVTLFCDNKRAELTLWKSMYATKPKGKLEAEPEQLMALMEEVATIVEYLKGETYSQKRSISTELLKSMYTHVKSCVKEINTWCSKKREELNNFKQQTSSGEGVSTVMNNMEILLCVFELWCKQKKKELEKYRKELNITEENLTAGNREGGELTPLNRV